MDDLDADLAEGSGDQCEDCGSKLSYTANEQNYSRRVGIEYGYNHPARYDGVSEWLCPDCGARRGRWTGRLLVGDDYERRFGS